MDWIGSQENGFSGAKRKLIECFPTLEPFTVIVFQSKTLEEVRTIKEKVRQVHKIGFSSIHITDTKEEARRISKLIFNENGIHFLNYSEPYKYSFLLNDLDSFNSHIKKNDIDKNDIVLDGSIVLAQYGLRKNADIDYLTLNTIDNFKYDTHDSQLKFHDKDKRDLIYNPEYFFQFNGFKYASFKQTFLMKKNRNEQKDLNDLSIMKSLIEKNSFSTFILKKKQFFYYEKIKFYNNYNVLKFFILKKTGLYKPLRFIYKKIKK